MTFGVEKLEWCGYPVVNKFENTIIRFDRIHGRTNGRTEDDRIG